MRRKGVATQYARKFMGVYPQKSICTVFLVISFLTFTSCDKSDELERIGKESPTPNEPPAENESLIVYTDIEVDFSSKSLGDS